MAYVHGARHNLWWEFRLRDSFCWQALVTGLPPGAWEGRMGRLAGALGIRHLLDRRVEELAPAERALADLAVALLPQPKVLVWEEPFALLGPGDRKRAARLVRSLQFTQGLVLAVVGPVPAELAGGRIGPGRRARAGRRTMVRHVAARLARRRRRPAGAGGRGAVTGLTGEGPGRDGPAAAAGVAGRYGATGQGAGPWLGAAGLAQAAGQAWRAAPALRALDVLGLLIVLLLAAGQPRAADLFRAGFLAYPAMALRGGLALLLAPAHLLLRDIPWGNLPPLARRTGWGGGSGRCTTGRWR